MSKLNCLKVTNAYCVVECKMDLIVHAISTVLENTLRRFAHGSILVEATTNFLKDLATNC
jgi:hypothetical protein